MTPVTFTYLHTENEPRAIEKTGEADDASTVLFHPELLIRKTFEHDPKKGCSLLFRRYYAGLCNHVVRFVYSKQIAEDIVSEVFCDFWKKQVYLQIKVSYRAYLYAAVRHRAVDHFRKEMSRKPTVSCEQLDYADQLPDPDELMQYGELYQQVENAIAQLPVQCQKVFLMSRFEGKKYYEIARELSLSTKTVEAHISRALLILRKSIFPVVVIGCAALDLLS